MASSSSSTIRFLVLLPFALLLAQPTAARPCKAIFISYTLASSQISSSDDPSAPRFFAVYRVIHPLRLHYTSYPDEVAANSYALSFSRPARTAAVAANEPAEAFSSLRDRAKDILVVVVGLLFGVGCGALTAATMYLAWSLLTNRYDLCGSDGGYDYEDEEEEIESPKKMGYTSIPPAPATPASPVKEGYEEKN